MKKATRLLASCVLPLVLSTPAHANLVTNAGFETGNFDGWTTQLIDENPGDPSQYTFVSSSTEHSGSYSVRFSDQTWNVSHVDRISQVIATVPGETYTVDFWLTNVNPGYQLNANAFRMYFGSLLMFENGMPLFDWTHYSFDVTATSDSTLLLFAASSVGSPHGYYEGTSRFFLDDVSVTHVTSVPEPETIGLFGCGLIALAARTRRRPKA